MVLDANYAVIFSDCRVSHFLQMPSQRHPADQDPFFDRSSDRSFSKHLLRKIGCQRSRHRRRPRLSIYTITIYIQRNDTLFAPLTIHSVHSVDSQLVGKRFMVYASSLEMTPGMLWKLLRRYVGN